MSTSSATSKAGTEGKPLIAAVDRCATQRQGQHRLLRSLRGRCFRENTARVNSCPSRSWRSQPLLSQR
jgi:hypothetical protein